jgi:hypothetical protein
MENQIVELTQEKLDKMQEQVYKMFRNTDRFKYQYNMYDLSRVKALPLSYEYYKLTKLLEQILDVLHKPGMAIFDVPENIHKYMPSIDELDKVITDIRLSTKLFYDYFMLLQFNMNTLNVFNIQDYQRKISDRFSRIRRIYQDDARYIINDLYKEADTHSSIINQHMNCLYIMLYKDHRNILDAVQYRD